jgi:hypothetical protein
MEGIEGVEERVVNASALDVSSFIVQATSTPKKKMKASLVCDTCGKLFGSKKKGLLLIIGSDTLRTLTGLTNARFVRSRTG